MYKQLGAYLYCLCYRFIVCVTDGNLKFQNFGCHCGFNMLNNNLKASMVPFTKVYLGILLRVWYHAYCWYLVVFELYMNLSVTTVSDT